VVEIECARVARLRQRHGARFVRRFFTERERVRCQGRRDPDASLAARFAARVGLAAFCRSQGIERRIRLDDVGVDHDAAGGPELILSQEFERELAGWSVELSLTHDGAWAAAAVMARPILKEA
jgi:holo-[acyl-carrier-protein] synthase